jgi:UDP-2,3-diacylglucosamine hydrolase
MPLVHTLRKAVCFVSDAHLGSGTDSDARGRALAEMLASRRDSLTHLYVLGDLFDFWFEYRHAIPKGGFAILHALADLVGRGVSVAYLGGNHDFWCGSFLEREVGLRVHQHPISVAHQGRRIYLAHGDGIAPGDTGYRVLKAVLRNPLAIALYRTIHPDLGVPLAHRVSLASRKHTRERAFYVDRFSRFVVAPRFADGHDAVIVGHVHDPLHLRDGRERDFLIVGDWLESFTFVVLEEGRFTLCQRRPEGGEVALPAQPWPAGMEPGPVGRAP